MPLRDQRMSRPAVADVVQDTDVAEVTHTSLHAHHVCTGDAPFAIGWHVLSCHWHSCPPPATTTTGACGSSTRPPALPVRGFPSYKGQQHHIGRWWTATTGGLVGYESWLERDRLVLLDFDPDVVGIASQPFWLFWTTSEGTARSHAPDYFARRADGRGAWHMVWRFTSR